MSIIVPLVDIAIWATSIYFTYKVAKRNGRDTKLAIFWSVLFSFWALLVYLLIGKPSIKN